MSLDNLQEHKKLATVLQKIIDDKRIWLQEQQQAFPLTKFINKLKPSSKSFYNALSNNKINFILECKKASPSKGLIRADFDPVAIAKTYSGYADVISVLTDEKYFQGDFNYLDLLSEQVSQPLLCKDFIIDPYQIYLARYHQADAILLMLSVLDDDTYLKLSAVAAELKMGVLTEASTEEEVKRAVKLKAKVIGINNRNLHNLTVDLNNTLELVKHIPADTIVISESGIENHLQIKQLAKQVNGFLIGSSLMAKANLELAIRALLFGENKVCGLTRKEDVQTAYNDGAVYGGLIFVNSSPRCINLNQAQTIVQDINLAWVGVFQNAEITQVCEFATKLNLTAVQLHGSEDQQYISTLRELLTEHCQIWQAVRIKDQVPSLDNPLLNRYVFDSGTGGTGKAFNWDILARHNLNKVILAGGINSDNILPALTIGAIGIDINSGAESSPGIKDPTKLAAILTSIRSQIANKSIMQNNLLTAKTGETYMPKLNPYFGEFGGQFIPEILVPALDQLEDAFITAQQDPTFIAEFSQLLNSYAGRPTPLTLCRNLTKGSKTKLYLKREDLLHGGAHKTNQVLGQALLAKRMNKTEIIAETGAGQHGVATALACALLGLKCRIYMGAKDVERQSPNVFRMKLLGATVISVTTGSATLKDACNEALRDWSANYETTHYLLGTAAGPHPYPTMVREFQKMIGEEAKQQILEAENRLPDAVIACVGGGSNAIGIFADFIPDEEVKLIGVEPGGHGIETGEHGAPLKHGTVGIYFGMKSPMMQTSEGQIEESYSISAGLDFPSVGPQHAYLDSIGRAEYVSITDNEALQAFQELSKQEGIIPALESSHALAYALKMINQDLDKEQILVVNISGRGDKDIFTVAKILEEQGVY